MDPDLAPDSGKRRFLPISLTGGLLLAMGGCAAVSLLPSLFAQGGDHKPTPPAFPQTVTLGASPSPSPAVAPAATVSPAAMPAPVGSHAANLSAPFIPPTVNLDPNATPTPPPGKINGNPAPGEAQIPGSNVATPTGLPGLAPAPIELPPTVILTAEERNGTGFGPHMSVPNEVHARLFPRRVARAQLDRPDPGRGRRQEQRLPRMPPRRRADAQEQICRARLHGLPRRRRTHGREGPGRRRRDPRPRQAGVSRVLAHGGQPGGILHHPQPRKPGVRALRQPGRPARGAAGLRVVPRKEFRARHQLHDERRPDALGRGAL